MAIPPCSATTTEIVFSPTASGTLRAVPLATAAPFIVRDAMLGSLTVGVTATLVTALPTLAAYAVLSAAKAGSSVPREMVRPLKSTGAPGIVTEAEADGTASWNPL